MKPISRLVAVLAFVCVSLFSNAQKFSTALELNNYFASINDTLYAGGKAWGTRLNTVMESKSFDSLTPLRVKLLKYINGKQQELKTMKDMAGSEKFRLAMLDFLAFEEKMMVEAFAPLEKLNKTSTDADVKKALNSLVALAANENAELKKVNDAQNEFAQKNGFTVEKEE
jgi:hypothetical protein